jgi:hypothetical protein
MIRILKDHVEASLENGIWTSDLPVMTNFLNSLREDFDTSSPSVPDPDLAFAEHVVANYGGEITHADPPEPLLEGVVY